MKNSSSEQKCCLTGKSEEFLTFIIIIYRHEDFRIKHRQFVSGDSCIFENIKEQSGLRCDAQIPTALRSVPGDSSVYGCLVADECL